MYSLVLAMPAAPFEVLGLSPAPMMIVVGIVLGSAFLVWTRQRTADQQTPLLAPNVRIAVCDRRCQICHLSRSFSMTLPRETSSP